MKPLGFAEAFFGTFIGVILFKSLIDIPELFQNWWANFFFESLVMGIFLAIVVLGTSWIRGKVWPGKSTGKA